MQVRKAYSQELAQVYDERHFGGRSGQYILWRDCSALESLLDGPHSLPGMETRPTILDLPCGTGAYTKAMAEKGRAVVAADASLPMLDLAGHAHAARFRVQCDIEHLPFKDDSFDAAVTLRLFSHYPKEAVARMLLELRRVIRPGGRVIFDSFRWTPRQWPVLRRLVDQNCIYVLSRHDAEAIIAEAGLRQVEARSLYLFSPLWQRKLPLWLVHRLTTLESVLPPRWRLRTLWGCTKDPDSAAAGSAKAAAWLPQSKGGVDS